MRISAADSLRLALSNPRMDVQTVSVPKLGYSLAEVEIATGLSRATLYRMLSAGQLSTVKVRGRRLVPAWQAQKLLEAKDQGRSMSC